MLTSVCFVVDNNNHNDNNNNDNNNNNNNNLAREGIQRTRNHKAQEPAL